MNDRPAPAERFARRALRRLGGVLAAAAALGLRNALEAERARWMLWVPVVFGAGIVLYFMLGYEPNLVQLAVTAVAAAGLLIAAGDRFWLSLLAGLALAAGLGLVAAKARTEWVRAPILERRLAIAVIEGTVELAEPRPGRGQRLTLRVARIEGLTQQATPKRIRLRAMVVHRPLRAGETIRIKATLAPPSPPAIPGGYDFGRTAWYAGLGATGYALTAPEVTGTASAGWLGGVSAGLENLRQTIGERIMAQVPGELGAIATSLITGERGGISESTTDAFRDSGLIHILSISGLHMVIMAGAVFMGLRLVLACIPSIALFYPTKKWAALAALVAAFGYLLMSGSSIATVRAFLMIAIMLLAVMADRPALTMRNVALSALLILVVMPESLLDAGFQMSYAAVVSLVAVYETLRDRDRDLEERHGVLWRSAMFLGGIVLSTLVASVAVAPFGIYHFHRSQQYALIANMIAVPICNVIVMPAGLATLLLMPFGLEAWPLAAMEWGLAAMLVVAEWVAALPGAVLRLPAISTAAFGMMIAGGLWLALWRTPWRALGLMPIALGIGYAPLGERPAVLAGFDGDLVAVRQSDGALAILARRSLEFELARWLEHDGDARTPVQARKGNAFRCDGAGCTAMHVAGGAQAVVSVAASGAGFADDCRRATVLISRDAVPKGCRGPRVVIDGRDLRRAGVHALYFEHGEAGGIRIETVAGLRGERPWSVGSRSWLRERRGRETERPRPETSTREASPLGAAEAAEGDHDPLGAVGEPDL